MRASGVLMAVSSLPSEYGIGCFSREAYEFVDQLASSTGRFCLLVRQDMEILRISPVLPLREIHILLIWMNWSGKGFLQKKNVLPAAGEMTPAMWIMKKYITADFHF